MEGAIVNLLLDNPQFFPTRPTDDLDVIDGRESIVKETALAPLPIRAKVTNAVRALLAQPAFDESLPGHLPSDASSQAHSSLTDRMKRSQRPFSSGVEGVMYSWVRRQSLTRARVAFGAKDQAVVVPPRGISVDQRGHPHHAPFINLVRNPGTLFPL